MKPVDRLNDRVTTGTQFGAAEEVLLLPGMGTVLGDIAIIAELDHSLLDRERGVGRLFPGSRSARQGRDLVADVAGHPGLGFGRQLPVELGGNQSCQHPGRRVTAGAECVDFRSGFFTCKFGHRAIERIGVTCQVHRPLQLLELPGVADAASLRGLKQVNVGMGVVRGADHRKAKWSRGRLCRQISARPTDRWSPPAARSPSPDTRCWNNAARSSAFMAQNNPFMLWPPLCCSGRCSRSYTADAILRVSQPRNNSAIQQERRRKSPSRAARDDGQRAKPEVHWQSPIKLGGNRPQPVK